MPEKFGTKEISDIVKLYDKFDGDLTKAVENSNYCKSTILYYWREKNLVPDKIQKDSKSKKIGRQLPPEKIYCILLLYKLNQGKISLAEKNSKFALSTIRKYWNMFEMTANAEKFLAYDKDQMCSIIKQRLDKENVQL